MNLYCINCKWFKDGAFSKVYITPRCTVRADEDAAYMRKYVCGLDGEFYEPKVNDGTPDRRTAGKDTG